MRDQIRQVMLDRFEEIRKRGEGQVKLQDVEDIVQGLLDTIERESKINNDMIESLSSIADEIRSMKTDIMRGYGDNEDIQVLSARLNTVTESTEKAANDIMDSAEAIQSMLPQLNNDYLAEQMMSNCTKIFEACDFQDLTGQHLTRVMKSVNTIKNIVDKVVEALGIEIEIPEEKFDRMSLDADSKELMNGRGIGNAPSQEDIDNLFNNA
ncbi:MAG: hypothetical protein MK137_08560 [Rickettsiales bacterium]|nr:hypothetical protein [Rickettsiales bacterium]